MASVTKLVRWKQPSGSEALCLLRAWPDRSLFVLTEIKENPAKRGINSDLPGVVRQVAHVCKEDLDKLQGGTWIIQHGPYSYYDNLDMETFTQVTWHMRGNDIIAPLENWKLLDLATPSLVALRAQLEPVEQALARLRSDD